MKNTPPTKKTHKFDAFARLNLGGAAPRCPLCQNFMEKKYVAERICFVFKCDVEKIAIKVDDPFVNKWDQALEKSNPDGVICPRPGCGTKMRYFATSVGFAMTKCPKPKCGTTLKMSEPDRLTDAPDAIYTPDAPGSLQ
jgi:hypothetical protein